MHSVRLCTQPPCAWQLCTSPQAVQHLRPEGGATAAGHRNGVHEATLSLRLVLTRVACNSCVDNPTLLRLAANTTIG